jgi:hypothetical protein
MAWDGFYLRYLFFQEVLKPMLLCKKNDLYFMNPLSKVSLAKSYIRFTSDWHVAMEECVWLQVFAIVFA